MKNLEHLIWMISLYFQYSNTMCHQAYGEYSTICNHNNNNNVVPAPPGKTPPCARPGLTYCEHPDHYPSELITYLVRKWKFDHSTLFTDESKQEFASYFYPPPSTVYGAPPHSSFDPHTSNYPEPIYIPKPQVPFQEPGRTYIPPASNNNSSNANRPLPEIYQSPLIDIQPSNSYRYSTNNNIPTQYPHYSYYHSLNDIWKRNERLKRSLKSLRSMQISTKHFDKPSFNNGTTTITRSKRQSTINGQTLCRTRTQYIMPRAALNNKGNWMYVVNMPQGGSGASQMVKSEICASQTCDGLCSLPQGYSSRCEQRYVQKRLVALGSDGNRLYNDVFWFPSCCICTISNS